MAVVDQAPGVDGPDRTDSAVSPAKQRELADAIGATVFEVALDHLQLTSRPDEYNPALLDAVAAVAPQRAAVRS